MTKELLQPPIDVELQQKDLALEKIQTQIKTFIYSPDSRLRTVGTIVGAAMIFDACALRGDNVEAMVGGAIFLISKQEKVAKYLRLNK